MHRKTFTTVVLSLLLIASSSTLVSAQTPDGTISGRVTNIDSGEPIEGICADRVTVTGDLVGRAHTDADGRYTIRKVGAGASYVRFNDCPGGRNHTWTIEYWQDAMTLGAATPIVTLAGEQITGIDEGLVGSVTDRVYHVAPDGIDTHKPYCPGGMKNHPWRTIEHGMRCMHPGDTLLVRGGTYEERADPVVRPGTREAPIRVAAYPGEHVRVAGLIRLAGADYWSLQGIEITTDGAPYAGGQFLLKMRDGVGWDVIDMNIHDVNAYAALRVETGDATVPEPADWRIADSCIYSTHPTNPPYRDHNLYVSTGLTAGDGLIERNVIFDAPNGQNIKLGAGNGPAGGTANVEVRHNTMWGGVQNVLASGPSRNLVLERNILGGVILPPDKWWYPNVRGFDLDGGGNVLRRNLGHASASDQHFLFNDENSDGGWRDGGGNVFPADPGLAPAQGCGGFEPLKKAASDYGAHAIDPFSGIARLCPENALVRNRFTDDDRSVHEVAIDCLAQDRFGVANGVNGGEYRPLGSVRRDQMASFIARVLAAYGVELPAATEDHFADDGDSAHEDNVNRLAAAGIAGGVGGDDYAPGKSVTRAQMATFLARAHEYATGTSLPVGGDEFRDDARSPHEVNINRVANAGIARGVGGDRYAPNRDVRRDQMATFLARTLQHLDDTILTP